MSATLGYSHTVTLLGRIPATLDGVSITTAKATHTFQVYILMRTTYITNAVRHRCGLHSLFRRHAQFSIRVNNSPLGKQ